MNICIKGIDINVTVGTKSVKGCLEAIDFELTPHELLELVKEERINSLMWHFNNRKETAKTEEKRRNKNRR